MRTQFISKSSWVSGLLLVLSGCSGLFGGDGSSALEGNDGGTGCEKDREALSELLVQPVACETTASCPVGSFCNLDTGVCDWECYTDSDCGFGHTCTCDGICQDGENPPDSDPPGDPSCPRNLDLLEGELSFAWTNMVGVVAEAQSLTRTASGSSWAAGAVSDQAIEHGGGFVEFSAGELSNKMIGLSHGDTNQSYSDIDFAVYLHESGNLYIYEGGAKHANAGQYVVGDLFRVEVANGVVTYLRNGTVVYTSLVAPQFPLLVDLSIYRYGGSVSNVRLASADRIRQRACTMLEDCPFGSHCNRASGGCDWHCLATDNPDHGCPDGFVCSCDGLCVEASADAAAMPTEVHQLALSAGLLEFGAIAAQRPLTLTLQTQSAELVANASRTPTITVRLEPVRIYDEATQLTSQTPAPFTLVYRDLSDPDAILASGDEIVLADWSFVSEGPAFRARVELSVEATAAFDPDAGPWLLTTRAEGVAGGSNQVILDGPSDPSAAPPTSGEYSGTVILANPDEFEDLPESRIPVTAWVDLDREFALFFDESRTLTPHGVLELPLAPGSSQHIYWLTAPNGNIVAGTAIEDPLVVEADGGLAGSFTLTLPTSFAPARTFRVELERGGDLTASVCAECDPIADPDCGAVCAEGVCQHDLNLCIPSYWSDETSYTAPQDNTYYPAPAWLDLSDWLEPAGYDYRSVFAHAFAFDWTERLLCYDTADPLVVNPYWEDYINQLGLSDDQSVGLDVLPYSGDLNCQDGRPPAAVPLGLQRDREAFGESSLLVASDLLGACLAELADTPSVTIGDSADLAATWFGDDSACISLGRFHPALLSMLFDESWVVAPYVSSRSQRLAQRLLSQWNDVHSFVGRQGREEAELRRALGAAAELMLGPQSFQLEDIVDRQEDGLRLLIGLGDRLRSLAPDVLAHPDYRVPRPVAYWTFDVEDMLGNRAIDVVGNSHLMLSSYSRPAWANQAIETPSQYVDVPEGPTAIRGDMTLSAWIDASSSTSSDRPIWYSLANSSEYLFRVGLRYTGGQFFPYARHGSITEDRVDIDQPLPGGVVHMVVVRDVSQMTYRFYVNGVFKGSGNYSHQPPEDSYAGPASRLSLRGYSDDFAAWDVALSDQQVARLFLDGLSTGQTGWRDNAAIALFEHEVDGGDQRIGLPVTAVASATEYLRTMMAFLDEIQRTTFGECHAGFQSPERAAALERVGRAVRYTLAVEALAGDLVITARAARACSTSDTCSSYVGSACTGGVCTIDGMPVAVAVGWNPQWREAVQELVAVRANLLQASRTLERCENALGIADDSLPLFFGDLVGDNARFFAASDYLTTTWAKPAVAAAASALNQARDTWVAKRNSEIQQLLTEHSKEQRLEQLELGYADEIGRLCGLSGIPNLEILDQFDSDSSEPLTADNCFVSGAYGCATGAMTAACYRGEMGELALAVIGANRDVDIAQATADAVESRHLIKLDYCLQLQHEVDAAVNVVEDHLQYVADLRRAQKWRRILSAAVALGQAALTGDASSAAGAINNVIEGDYQDRIDASDRSYEAYMQRFTLHERVQSCLAEVAIMYTEIRSARMQIGRRALDAERALLALANMKARVEQLVTEGDAAIAREGNREVPSVAHHYWLDERIDRFRVDFNWAKRLTYLALLAVEYEFQQCLDLHADILGAGNPDELSNAINILEQEQAGRTINGRRPEERSLVLSLRDDILQIASREDAPTGERNWSARERFGRRILSDEFAVYDHDGVYLGQGIPFTLKEDGALRLRCAERMWRVGATMQGDLLSEDAPGVTVLLYKRNTFKSQWCDGKGDDSEYQVGSVSPSAQLFHPDSDLGSEAEAAAYSAAMMFPWFNVPRSQFYQQAYVEGSSEELAGRGLYGDYLLLLPEWGMLDFTSSDAAERFPLRNVEDILVRFDFLSVDDSSL